MSTDIDTRISPALHPQNVKEIDGYGEDTAPILGPTETAFSAAYEGIRAVHAAREAAKLNPTWNEAQQIIHTDDLARKQFASIAKTFDTTRENLVKGIAHLEKELSAPVTSRAAAPIAAEIRAHVKGLQTVKLHDFIKEAIDSNDHDTVTAVLGAPSYLSGLTLEFQRTYLRFWHEKQSPDLARRLKVMVGARELIERNAPLVHKQLEKAVGAPPHKARALRDAKTSAEKHFVMGGN